MPTGTTGVAVRWFLPRNDVFSAFFRRSADNILKGVELFRDMLVANDDLEARVIELKGIEHEGDRITHQTLARLNTSFVTPFDREDIYALITRMDDILDATDTAAHRLRIYQIGEPTPRLVHLSELLVASAKQVREAVAALQDRRRREDALTSCVEINRLENEADSVHREALAELFGDAADPIYLLKMKELYAYLEDATDRCEDVANVIESIIIKVS